MDNLISPFLSLKPTVFLRNGSRSSSFTMLELRCDPIRVCLPVFGFFIVLFFVSWGYSSSIDIFDICLKSSLVLVMDRPRYAALADAAITKLPPLPSPFLSSCGDSNSDLNFRTLSSRCFTFKSPVISMSYCFYLSIYSSLCNFYSSSSFYSNSISSSYVSNLSSRSLMMKPK